MRIAFPVGRHDAAVRPAALRLGPEPPWRRVPPSGVLVASAVVPPAAICPMPALDLTLSASLRTAHRLARLPAPALAAAVVLGAAALVSAFIAIAIALALMVPAAVGLALPTRQCLRQEVCGCA